MNIWLMKSEPSQYSIDNLKKDKSTWWEGVRNYQARNFMMNDMKRGDAVLFYHSNAEITGIAGIAEVIGNARPDQTQFDKKSEYYDPKATQEKPIWYCTQIGFKEKFDQVLTLTQIKSEPKLSAMLLLKRGQRLSIQPVSLKEYEFILELMR